jgi:hypothetical protein
MKKRIFEEINIWQEIDDNTITRYRCFRVLPDNKFFVKGKDYFYYPIDENHIKSVDFYMIDSLFQGGLNMEDEFCESLAEAISKHEKDFA